MKRQPNGQMEKEIWGVPEGGWQECSTRVSPRVSYPWRYICSKEDWQVPWCCVGEGGATEMSTSVCGVASLGI